MIELPEAVIIARQINSHLSGKKIALAVRGNSPHKFAFYSRPAEEYAAILPEKVIGSSEAHGSIILTDIDPGYVLALGGGGERILYHTNKTTLPAKYQLLLGFEDGSHLSMSIQMWGSAQLWTPEEQAADPYAGRRGILPTSDEFTLDYFLGLFDEMPQDDKRFIKFFMISKPGVWGLGNGYLQDILFLAGIHPRRRANDLSQAERRSLYQATRDTLTLAIAQNGRDSERDIFNRPGEYRRLLDSTMVGQPCPKCGDLIEKINFLGGASYYCPQCQPLGV